MTPDFTGYATRNDIVCSDGRIIRANAFKHQDGAKVPLLWSHSHNDSADVLGHVLLENREDGVYAKGFFNNTEDGQRVKEQVRHGDVTAMSIYARKLIQKGVDVVHGAIHEVSLVLAGANPGAYIDNVNLQHGDMIDTLDDEVFIQFIDVGGSLSHAEDSDEGDSVDDKEETVQDVLDSMTPKQVELAYAMAGEAVENVLREQKLEHNDSSDEDSEEDPDEDDEDQSDADNGDDETDTEAIQHSQEGSDMSRVFDKSTKKATEVDVLSHSDVEAIFADAKKNGSLRDAFQSNEKVLAHEGTYGIDNIDVFFPDAQNVTTVPDVIGRRTEWVGSVLGKSKHSPFSRIRSTAVDLTADEARAKGYVRGNLKKEEVIKLLKRVTTPTTVYKKQKLDRDDIVDITGLDVVSWLKAEMRVMLDEEVARAILIGDGREIDDPDKIDEDHLRPIAYDVDMYAHQVNVPSNIGGDALVESILRARKHYKGTGTPDMYTTDDILTDLILLKDKIGRRLYNTEAELAAALRVSSIIVVEVMEDVPDILAIIVNIADYTVGADKGGKVAMFDDFDIDYNQEKYLIETRISGALTKPKSAVVIKRSTGTTVVPAVPSYDPETSTLTIPTVAGVTYYNVTSVTGEVVIAAGDHVIVETTDIEARPNAGYNFPHNTDADWTFAFTE